jgi:cobalt-zinc-cadmium efflux system outer membrane protein
MTKTAATSPTISPVTEPSNSTKQITTFDSLAQAPRKLSEGIQPASANVPNDTPAISAEPLKFTPEAAVRFALENNPSLQAIRQQRGFAQGGLVIARTYPYNPVSQFQLFGATGEGVTNSLTQAHKITMDVEVCGQRRFRQQAAYAAITRTEWEIATQELLVSVAANRAFNTVLYRQRKLDVLNDTIKLNEQMVEQVKKLVELGRLRPADLIVARTELDAANAQLGQGRTAIAFARADLRRQFGTLDDTFTVTGELDLPLPTTEYEPLAASALENRPDVQSRKIAVTEAQARLRLQVADRYGNPNFGPAFDYNETKNAFYGFQIGGPIPVFNLKKGEIMQAQATFSRALSEVRQFEIQSSQDVQAALARLTEARKWADRYSAEALPNLRKAVTDMNKLLEQNEPGVDVLKVIGVQRNYLTTYSAFLDAQFEVSQARADLAAAVGDPSVALGLYAPATPPGPVAVPNPNPVFPGPVVPLLPVPAPMKDKP